MVLIPNIHLENPHYEITRVRTDDVDDNAEPSYKQVAEPETEEAPFASSKATKAARPEPAVKGVQHTQPAPVYEEVKPAELTWWDKFKAWFKGIFGSSTPPAVEAENRLQVAIKPATAIAAKGRTAVPAAAAISPTVVITMMKTKRMKVLMPQ